jgi:hypothetical protein
LLWEMETKVVVLGEELLNVCDLCDGCSRRGYVSLSEETGLVFGLRMRGIDSVHTAPSVASATGMMGGSREIEVDGMWEEE